MSCCQFHTSTYDNSTFDHSFFPLLLDRIIATNPVGWTSPAPFSYNFLPRRPKRKEKSKEQMKKKKRLGHDDRINIQAAIAKGLTLAQAARLLGKSRSTVYREIANNATIKDCRHTCSHCAKSCAAGQRPPYRDGRCPLFEARGC